MSGSKVPQATVRAISFLWGMQNAFLSPALALLLVNLFGASTGQVALVLAAYHGVALLGSWALPRRADRTGDYLRPMLISSSMTIVLAVALTLATSLPQGVAALIVLGAPASMGTPLLFGYIRHAGALPAEVVQVRAVYSAAWVAGPPLAAAIIAGSGSHALVAGIGVVGLLNVVATGMLLRTTVPRPDLAAAASAPAKPAYGAPAPTASAAAEPAAGDASSTVASRGVPSVAVSRGSVSRGAVALLVLAVAALQATNSAAVAVTTLFVTQTLELSALWGGIALGVAAALEIPFLLILGRLGRPAWDVPILTVACLVGAMYYVGAASTSSGPALVGLQVLNAAFYAVFSGVGLTLFQAIIPGPGAAAGLLFNAQRVGALLSGPLIGIGALGAWGLRTVFVACAVLSLVSLVLVRFAARRLPETLTP